MKMSHILLSTAAAILLAPAASFATTSYPAPEGLRLDYEYAIVSAKSKLCLDLLDKSTANGARFQQWGCHSRVNQRFSISAVGKDQFKINLKAVDGHKIYQKVLSVKDSDHSNGAVVQQWDNLNGVDNQILDIKLLDNGNYNVKFTHSGKCLDVSGASHNAGTRLQQWDCNDEAQQEFIFIRLEQEVGSPE